MVPSNFRFFGSVLLLLTVGALQGVRAQDAAAEAVATDVPVYYGDLNIDKALGAETLVKRIANAAKQACGARPTFTVNYRILRARYDACVRAAEQSAVATVNRPAVTAAFVNRDESATTRIATR